MGNENSNDYYYEAASREEPRDGHITGNKIFI